MEAESPQPSVTVKVTVNVPAVGKVCVGDVPVLFAVPSPQAHVDVNVLPLGSEEPAAEKLHTRPLQFGVPITGVGAALAAGLAIVTARVVVAVSPQASVTVSVTV